MDGGRKEFSGPEQGGESQTEVGREAAREVTHLPRDSDAVAAPDVGKQANKELGGTAEAVSSASSGNDAPASKEEVRLRWTEAYGAIQELFRERIRGSDAVTYQDLEAKETVSARDLFQVVNYDRQFGEAVDPAQAIGLVGYQEKDGGCRIVVYLGCTDARDLTHGRNVVRAVQMGASLGKNWPYLRDAERHVKQFQLDHPELADAPITLVGYSQGGMVAQELARKWIEDPHSSQRIDQIICYGSPLTGPPEKGVREYRMYVGQYDNVPHLSAWSNSLFTTWVKDANFIDRHLPGNPMARYERLQASWGFQENPQDLKLALDPQGVYGDRLIICPDENGPYPDHFLKGHTLYGNLSLLQEEVIPEISRAEPIGRLEWHPTSLDNLVVGSGVAAGTTAVAASIVAAEWLRRALKGGGQGA